jgi:hypothetical protein
MSQIDRRLLLASLFATTMLPADCEAGCSAQDLQSISDILSKAGLPQDAIDAAINSVQSGNSSQNAFIELLPWVIAIVIIAAIVYRYVQNNPNSVLNIKNILNPAPGSQNNGKKANNYFRP